MEENEKGMAVEQCKHCKFYMTEDYETDGITYERTFGYCKRFPPRRIDGITSGFPVIEDDWWCGEFQKKFVQNDNKLF